jgi:hypothetical protein
LSFTGDSSFSHEDDPDLITVSQIKEIPIDRGDEHVHRATDDDLIEQAFEGTTQCQIVNAW